MTSPSERIGQLQRLVDLINVRIAMLPPYSYDERATYYAAVNKILDQLIEREDAKYTARVAGGACAFKLAGIRATCTGSATGAMKNWIAAARREIAKLGGVAE